MNRRSGSAKLAWTTNVETVQATCSSLASASMAQSQDANSSLAEADILVTQLVPLPPNRQPVCPAMSTEPSLGPRGRSAHCAMPQPASHPEARGLKEGLQAAAILLAPPKPDEAGAQIRSLETGECGRTPAQDRAQTRIGQHLTLARQSEH